MTEAWRSEESRSVCAFHINNQYMARGIICEKMLTGKIFLRKNGKTIAFRKKMWYNTYRIIKVGDESG